VRWPRLAGPSAAGHGAASVHGDPGGSIQLTAWRGGGYDPETAGVEELG